MKVPGFISISAFFPRRGDEPPPERPRFAAPPPPEGRFRLVVEKPAPWPRSLFRRKPGSRQPGEPEDR